jgi:hypothetical protein
MDLWAEVTRDADHVSDMTLSDAAPCSLQEDCASTAQGWLEDPSSNVNPTVCLVAGA